MKLLRLLLTTVLLLCSTAAAKKHPKLDCHGPLLCKRTWVDTQVTRPGLRTLIEAAQERLPDNATFVNSEHALCLPDPGPAHKTKPGHKYPNAGLCVWAERVDTGDGISGKRIEELLRLLERAGKCNRCGHVAAEYISASLEDGDPSITGEVTVAVVKEMHQRQG